MKPKPPSTEIIEAMKRELRLDADSGLVFRSNGDVAGCPHHTGYLVMKFRYRQYLVHRVVWMLWAGSWPVDQIDHANRIKTDNRPVNLRECSQGENLQNMPRLRSNKTGFPGVYFNKTEKKYIATIGANRKYTYLGSFDTAEAAGSAYREAKARLHAFHPHLPTDLHNPSTLTQPPASPPRT